MHFIIKLLATCCFIGYAPLMPGTAGSLAAAVIWWLLPQQLFFLLFLILIPLSIPVCEKAERIFGNTDDKRIVLDELLGFFTAVAFLPKSVLTLVCAFLLFRVFDIKKPFGINKIQNLHGSAGILLDDIAAGFITNILTLILLKIICPL